jgi:hypothetical protein
MPRRGGNQLIAAAFILIPVYEALSENQPFDRADYVRRLAELPADWPPPEEPGPR